MGRGEGEGERERERPLVLLCSATGEWEAVLVALYSESGSNWNPTPGHKLYEREQLTAKKSQEVANIHKH